MKKENTSTKKPVAIIGMSGFFPESDSIQEFTEKLENQESFVKTIPDDHDPLRSDNPKKGAFVKNLRGFDAKLFHTLATEAKYMTPQQRMLLMSVWNLFEDACILPSSLKNKKVAVIVGKELNPYVEYLTKAPITAFTCLGLAETFLPNRISNFFDFKGPSYCINTSCSSGLEALHQGKKMLQNQEVDYVIVASVSLIYGNEWTNAFYEGARQMGLMTAKDQGGNPFQEESSGFTPSEGIISMLLKRKEEAITDNDNIYAQVLGSASAHVGGNGNIAFPVAREQSKAIIEAYNDAQINSNTVTHIEAHAASSVLADSEEIKAFKLADKHFINDQKPNPCKISTLKPNIGHMHAASGLASVIRLITCFKAGKKLGIKNFNTLNKEIKLDKTRFVINEETENWEQLLDENKNKIPRRGGVNNFGNAGTVVHAILEEYIPSKKEEKTVEDKKTNEIYYLPLSCLEYSQFVPYAKSIKGFLEKNPDIKEELLEYHYLTSRKELNQRIVFRYRTVEDLIEKLTKFIASEGKSAYYVNGNYKEALSLNEIFLKNGKVTEFLNELNDKKDRSILFDLWSKGYEEPVHKYFEKITHPKISLPGYPFKLQTYWLDVYGHKEENTVSTETTTIITTASKVSNNEQPIETVAQAISTTNIKEQVIAFLQTTASELLDVSIDHIAIDEEIGDYGFNSVALTEFANILGENYKIKIVPTVFYNYPTIQKLAAFLLEDHSEALSTKHQVAVTIANKKQEPILLKKQEDKPIAQGCKKQTCAVRLTAEKAQEPIAIVGMSGRFPGSPNVNAFWENIKANKDMITEVPKDRWNWEDHYGDSKEDQRKTKAKWGGFIKDIDKFDPLHFSISPKEAELMDPQHRLAIEEAYHALEDAGINPKSLSGTNTGVFIGSYFDDYATLIDRSNIVDSQIITGLSQALVSNRISYLFDFNGPSETIDTACSSSLVAVKRGVERIRNGECDVVIAGGVSLVLMPDLLFPLSQAGFLSQDGRCKTFDQSADGYVRGEGVGMIVMKSLSQAKADGDRIYAVIKSASENHGGKANTLTSPNPQAQKELLIKAYSDAKIDLDQVGYIEAHGTGTPLGDPIETEGLKLAFKELYKESNKAFPNLPQIKLGSVKTNIGHLEPAAGIAGIIKLINVLKYKTIPGNPHLKNKNSYLDLANSPFELQRETTPWFSNTEKPKVAGISSFGAGGSNSHVVLEEYISEEKEYESSEETLIILSARNKKRLKDQVHNLLTYIKSNTAANIHNISFTLQVGREAMDERLAILATSTASLEHSLQNYSNGVEEDCYTGNSKGAQKTTTTNTELETIINNNDLRSLGALWTKGVTINWNNLYVSNNKPTIISLPTYPFARQRYWIPEIKQKSTAVLKNVTVQKTANKRITLYQDNWKEIHLDEKVLPEGILLVLNSTEDHKELILALKKKMPKIVVADSNQMDEISFEHVVGIIDLGATSKTNYNWLTIVQKVINDSKQPKLSFVHLSETGNTSIGKGLYQTLGAEYSKISSIALELGNENTTTSKVKAITTALSNSLRDARLKYTLGKFEVPYLTPASLPNAKKIEGPVLITGGTRGLGMSYAKHLVEVHNVKQLVLLGRQEFPAKTTWNTITDSSLVAKIKDVQYLESLGARVKLISPSLIDKEALQQALSLVKNDWGNIRGLIHCAGLVDRETPAFIRKSVQTISKLQEPKVLGLHNLYDVLAAHSIDFGILFSSISALVPHLGAGQCDYAMCNAYLEGFAAIHAKEGYRSIQWPSWKETGMGEVTDGIYRELGLLSLTNEEGAQIIDQVIALHPEDTISTIAPMVYATNEFSVENILEIPEKEETQANVAITKVDSSSITDWVTLQISEALKLPTEEIELDIPFQEYGVDSILLADLVKQLEKQLGDNVSLSPTIILEHPTVGMLGEYFAEHYSSNLSAILNEEIIAHETVEKSVHKEKAAEYSSNKKANQSTNEPIAIVGMGCHFPDASNIGEYWENLINAKDSIKDVPASRWSVDAFYSPTKEQGKSYSKWGGFLDNIEDFDPGYFKIPEALAPQLDPLERQWLEVSAEAIEDAGYDKKTLWGKKVGVYAGSRAGNFRQKLTDLHKDFIVGTGQNFITAHLAHIYNLKGPNMVVDTACSSSLTAIDLAVKDLRLGITEMAFAGGVDILLDQDHFVSLSTAEVLSKDGRTKAFDEKADGTGLGEGCGVIILKRLKDAIDNGDKIYAVIDSTSVNNDGNTMGITTPNPKAQQELIETAIENGNIDRSTISYVEAHGTGTLIGDPIELKGITAVLGKNNTNFKCAVGSVKTNIGHLMSAAGIAGVIKVALSISAKQLPPTLNCQTPNPRFDFENSPVYPIRALQDWEGVSDLRRAGISAFGLGGNNAHVILSNEGIPDTNKIQTPFNTSNIPFNRKRFWPVAKEKEQDQKHVKVNTAITIETPVAKSESKVSNTSMAKYFATTKQKEGSEWVFTTNMENDHYILRDHKVHGVRIVPGVTYLDLILRCSKELFGKTLSISRIIFVEPLATNETYNRRLQVRFKKGKHSICEVEVQSRRMDHQGNEYGEWDKHMLCRLNKMKETPAQTINIAAFKASYDQKISMADVYKSARSVEIVHGEFMETLGTVYQKGREELMQLHLSDLSASYLEQFFLSPALLDGATFSGSSFHAITQNQVSYIPYSVEEFNAYHTLPSTIYVYSKHQVEKYDKPSEVLKSNITIYDESGLLLAEFKNLAIKRIRNTGLITSLLAQKGKLLEV